MPYSETNKTYWEEKNIPGGYFSWIYNDLIELKYYKNILKTKIGVPQGGAISGLIANIELNYSDQEVLKLNDPRLLYLRFCDDMVIIHPSKTKCKIASDTYYKSLQKLHLVPHKFTSGLENKPKSFWSEEIKSKYPYKWSTNYKDSFPWFGFLGYEISYSGDLRVRKKSLIKEKKKQKEVITNILRAIIKGRRKNDDSIYESAANRLIGMSVGRLNRSNFNTIKNEMCWARGFIKLKDNRHLRAQLKDLDKYRAFQLSTLLKSIKNLDIQESEASKMRIKKSAFVVINGISDIDSFQIRNHLASIKILNSKFRLNRNVDLKAVDFDFQLPAKYEMYKDDIFEVLMNPSEKSIQDYYGKPYSYYYQIIERRNKPNNLHC